ncbi:YeeE/YedE family protein [Planktomarina temperata]|nr:YeeE/YedE family protein [Planktomarina temperata]
MLDTLSEPAIVAWIGLAGGVVLGLVARIGRFCTLGALEDLFYGDSSERVRMWGIAIGLSIAGSFAAQALGWIDLTNSIYLSAAWNPWASVAGGLTFGYGMALAGNCGYGALARLGGGDIRAFIIVLVMGIFAYMTIAGPLAYMRIWVFGGGSAAPTPPSIAFALSDQFGLSLTWVGMGLGFCIFALAAVRRPIWQHLKTLFWGGLVAGAIVSGWIGTQWIATHGFEELPVVTHTFSAPIGESLIYLMSASGNSVSFATGSVLGVLIGAFLGSIFKGHFRWEACDDARELRRQIFGAALMGVGSVLALGCSVGQGLSAFSTLAYGAPVTLICIMIGAAIGLRQLIQGFHQID